MPKPQPALFADDFETASQPNPIFCHQEFLEKLDRYREQPIAKRAGLLMQRLAVDERRQHYKATQGVNRGWRRSRLGGHHGSQFYAWWAPRGALPLQNAEGFSSAPDGAIFLRDIRHHDDHSLANPQSLSEYYLQLSVLDLRREEYGPNPWTPAQWRFASARHAIRVLKGHPGSGKTTALLQAADQTGAQRVLYLTYSSDLAGLARLHFDRFCSRDRHFHVATFQNFLRQLLGVDAPTAPERELRRRFQADIYPFARYLGPWSDHVDALYDELHAHASGAALPITVGRFTAASNARVSDASYRERRTRFLGPQATAAALDALARLDKLDQSSIASRYFPELALAWRAAKALVEPDKAKFSASFLDFDCIAVDECQDLTPLEAFIVVQLAALIGKRRRGLIPLLLAGDEAQTVRPTDFEWGWMSDLLHHIVGTPSEYKLATNLRSPHHIASLVNRVWDLYSQIEKRDRPSGTGYAEIDDDATDQILYCTAAPGPDLDKLLSNLAAREGLAMVTLDDTPPPAVPEPLRNAVLTCQEIKGLDFHSVCVLDAGRHLRRILEENNRFLASDIESLRKRLAIDRFRVALSRPTERLIWIDISPNQKTVADSIDFLNHGEPKPLVSPSVPSALLDMLGEEHLDLEERIQRCQADARQFLGVRPDLAWSRAQQAVALLGELGSPAAILDPPLRAAANMTLTEVCFKLAFRNARLAPELGDPDLFQAAQFAAIEAKGAGLSFLIVAVDGVMTAHGQERLQAIARLIREFTEHAADIEPWLLVELGGKLGAWVDELEANIGAGENAAILADLLPPFFDALKMPDAEARKRRLEQRSVQILVKNKKHAQALAILAKLPKRDYRLEAACHEGMGRFRFAADAWRNAGDLKEALRCYRTIPDFDAALALIRELQDHPAAESYEWLTRLRAVLDDKPERFNRIMQASEKKVLEELLERALGVARKKPATRKVAAKKRAPAKRK